MSCDFPISAWRGRTLTDSGKRGLVFRRDLAWKEDERLDLPCGRCTGCRLKWARDWALRCMHEKRQHLSSAFITLSYNDKHLPVTDRGLTTLRKEDFQNFMKRLRHRRDERVKFYACGEYGDDFGRPHYHCLLFNTNFPDMREFKTSRKGHKLYRSSELDRIWSVDGECLGHAWIGEVTNDSCMYVAKYCLKKVTGDKAEQHYAGREPERSFMSLKNGGIGGGWFDRFGVESYMFDNCIVEGKEVPLTRFYDKKLEKIDRFRLARLKRARRLESAARPDYGDHDAKRYKERVRDATLKFWSAT